MKTDINPMRGATRCRAHSKRTGLPCRSPAVRGWTVCRMHGAGGGAPHGERNGNYRHGQRTQEAARMKAMVRDLLRASRKTIQLVD